MTRSICDILKESKNIAVVGISDKIGRDSRDIALFLKEVGFNVVGVNPNINRDIDGIKVYRTLEQVPFSIDIVDVFRRSETIPELVPDILKVKPKVVWLQLGIENNEAMDQIRKEGIETIQNQCIYIEYRRCR